MFSLPVRIYWEDTDAGGVVYHAQYLAFLERARTEWMRVQGYGQDLLRLDHDLVFAVRAMTLDFLKPATATASTCSAWCCTPACRCNW
jgi:acyl-CoA thioester hydrolase